MFKTLLAVLLGVLLVGCTQPKVLVVAQEQGFTLTIFDAPCENAAVVEIYKSLGAPDEVLASLKQAKVVDPEGVSQEACSATEGPMGEFPDSVYLIGESGQKGYFSIGQARPMKHDNPRPGMMGTSGVL